MTRKQPQDVSTTILTETQTQQVEMPGQLKPEATEREILQQTQPASENSYSLTVHSDKETVQHSQYVNNYEADTDYNQYEEKEEGKRENNR